MFPTVRRSAAIVWRSLRSMRTALVLLLLLALTAAAQTNRPALTPQLENIARNWMNQDEKAARAWIQQLPLTEEKKRALLDRKR